jgi:hypothetical protein
LTEYWNPFLSNTINIDSRMAVDVRWDDFSTLKTFFIKGLTSKMESWSSRYFEVVVLVCGGQTISASEEL